MKKSTYLLAILVVVTAITMTVSNISAIHEKWHNFSNDFFEISYPEGWTPDTSRREMGASLILLSEAENESDNFRENINVNIQDLSKQKMTVEQFAKISEAQINKMIQDVTILRSEKATDTPGRMWCMEFENSKAGEELRWKQYYYPKDDKMYVLTFTAKKSAYDKYHLLADKIMNSFTLH
jgi:serine/threonine-protein kinase